MGGILHYIQNKEFLEISFQIRYDGCPMSIDQQERPLKAPVHFARRLEKIPARFFQSGSGRPFTRCDICDAALFEPTTRYMINKFYAAGEMQHEMVVCDGCQGALQTQYSPDSRTFLDSLLARVDLASRYRLVFSSFTDRVARMTAYCILCQTSRDKLHEYFEYAECQSDRLLISLHPTLVCTDCAQEIYSSLSPETRAIRRQFFEPHFGSPPITGKKIDKQNGKILHPMV